jgi:hypothetical protein
VARARRAHSLEDGQLQLALDAHAEGQCAVVVGKGLHRAGTYFDVDGFGKMVNSRCCCVWHNIMHCI